MKYIIMCGGTYMSWKTLRQFVMFRGEKVIERTIRLLREAGVEDLAISSNNPEFEQFGLPVLKHTNIYNTWKYNVCSGYWCDGFYPTDEPTCYVFGDVVFSRAAINKIVKTETDDIMLFGSAPPFAPEYPKPWIEPFAFKVQNPEHLRQAVADVKRLDAAGRFRRRPIAWELWNVISRGPDGDVNIIDYKSYVHINDWTCDLDYPGDIELFERLASLGYD